MFLLVFNLSTTVIDFYMLYMAGITYVIPCKMNLKQSSITNPQRARPFIACDKVYVPFVITTVSPIRLASLCQNSYDLYNTHLLVFEDKR